MPSHVVHDQLYLDVYNRFPHRIKQKFKDIWSKHKILAQGHDLLYFYMALNPLQIPTILKHIGVLEDKDIQGLAVNYIGSTRKHSDESKAFLYGYLAHHFSDARLHPLIIYESGDFKNDVDSADDHFLLESMLDAYMLKKSGENPQRFKIHNLVPNNMSLSRKTRKIINHSFKKTYDISNLDTIFAEYNKNARLFLTYFRHDPKGIKKKLFKALDLIVGKLFRFSMLPYNYDGTEAIKHLNNDNQPLPHPLDGKNISDKSFDELYAISVKEITDMLTLLDEAIDDKAYEQEIRDLVPNISAVHGYEQGSVYTIEHTRKPKQKILRRA